MKITVIGGSGFLGSHVADQLSKAGHDVTIFDKVNSKWIRKDQKIVLGNVMNSKDLEKVISKSKIVYHFAALGDIDDTVKKPIETAKVNIIGTLNVLELCKKYKVKRLIFASTIYVYSTDGNFYKCSKQSSESFIEEYNKQYNLEYTILRYGSIYGPRSNTSNGIYRIVDSAIKNKQIVYEGDKDSRREYIHVEDAAIASVKTLNDEFINQNLIITGQQSYKVENVLKMLSEIVGIKKIKFKKSKTEGHYVMTPYNYQPKIAKKFTQNIYYDFGQGLMQLIEEIKNKKWKI